MFLDFRQPTEAPKENPFSFKHFLRRDPSSSSTINHSQSNTNIVNGNEVNVSTSNGPTSSSQSPSKSATTSSLNSTGARPKIPQFQSVNVIHSQADAKMKRSPKFSSFDSQSSLSELAEERNMHGSRSNNSFNMDYQFPSSRSYSNYDIEPSSSGAVLDRKPHGGVRNFAQRSQSNVNNTSNSILPDFVQDHLLMEYYSDSPSANMSPLSGDDFSLGNCDSLNHQNGGSKGGRDPFDMTFNRSPNVRRRTHQPTIPLDLPIIDRSHRSASSDLPPDLMDNAAGSNVAVQREETYGPHNEPEITRDQAAIDKMQTLPDFLSDGPIHSSGRLADVATINHDEDNQSIIYRLQQENERLRIDLEESRRVIIDMESQISHAKNLETQYNVTLAESMEQVEENLFASNQRAAEAQAQANKFKQQVKQLTVSLVLMVQYGESETFVIPGGSSTFQTWERVVEGRWSSWRSRRCRGWFQQPTFSQRSSHGGCNGGEQLEVRVFLFSFDFLNFLSVPSRQLLSGVENLRLIASTIENLDQPSATNLDYLSDSDENDFTEGPAL